MCQYRQNPGSIGTAAGTADNGNADGDGFSVGQCEIALCFHAVADGVAQIQLHPGSGVEFVLHDHVPLQLHAAGDHIFPVKIQTVPLQMGEKGGIVQNAVLDYLGTAVPEDFTGEGIQSMGVAQHQAGLAESAYQILSGGEIDGGLTANGGIHGRQQRGGNLNEPDSPQIGGSRETSQISCDAAPQGNNQVGTGEPLLCQKIQKRQIGFGIFAFLPGWEYEGNNLESGRFQATDSLFPEERIYGGFADQADHPRLPQLPGLRAQLIQKAASDENVVGFGGADRYRLHPSTSSLRRLPSSRRAVKVPKSSCRMASW